MIVTIPNTSIDWLSNNLYVYIIREPEDVFDRIPISVCVVDDMGTVVAGRTFDYTPDEEVRQYAVDLSSLSDGVYWVYVYNWNSCSPPLAPGVIFFRYLIHKYSDGAYVSFEGWDYSLMRIFAMYEYDGKLFTKYLVNTSDMVIPYNVPVYIEAADRSRNAFVGSVRGYSTIYVRPNMRVPFMAIFTIKLNQPRAIDFARHVQRYIGLMRGAAVRTVDDYTLSIVITKTEPGLGQLGAFILGALIGLGIGFLVAGGMRVVEVSVQGKALENAKQVADILYDAWRHYTNEVSMCPEGDAECIERVQRKWFPLVQVLSALLGNLYVLGFRMDSCNGINVGGVCVPWWVVAVAVFLAGLLVISAVK
jgi:hypothetical protein